jgi:DNA-binding PucR family transcriptional regulator
VLGPVLELGEADRETLLNTLATWLDGGGSASRAAGYLYCHRNTVFNRLRRVEQLTSRSLQRPWDVVELALALQAVRLTGERTATPDTPPNHAPYPVPVPAPPPGG